MISSQKTFSGASRLVIACVLALAAPVATRALDPNSDAAGAAGAPTDTAILTLVDPPTASYDGRIPGLPRTKPGQAKKLALDSQPVKSYRAYLAARRSDLKQWLQANGFKGAVVREYDLVLNAIAVRLNGGSIEALRAAPGVATVEYGAVYRPMMSQSLALVNAGMGNLGGLPGGGRGVKVGVIDGGIDQRHRFFDPATFSYPAGFPKTDVRCAGQTTPKVIAARVYFYNQNLTRRGGFDCAAVGEHGTHVAGTIAGIPVDGATVTPLPVAGTVAGVAPGAWLGSYNVFPGNLDGARSEDIAQAVEDAVADGMDVLNLSLGGSNDKNGGAQPDALESALNHAADAGVVSVVAAGNTGPAFFTVESPGEAERVLTVAASSNPHYFAISVRAGGSSFGAALGDFGTFATPVTAPLALATPADGCTAVGSAVSNAIAIVDRGACSFSTKIRNAQQAGARAVLVVNNVGGDPAAMATDGTPDQPTISAVMLALDDRAAIRALAGASATVDGSAARELVTANANLIASFSSTGPVDRTYALKPDVTGPGVNVLSSVPGGAFAMLSGTSMSAPHAAGAVALLLQQHPAWTPDQVKSALVTTGQRVVKALPPATGLVGALKRGGGLLDLAKAGAATAAFAPASVGFGFHEANGTWRSSQAVTVTNVSAASQTLALAIEQGSKEVTYSVSPSSLTLAPGDTATVTVTVVSSGVSGTLPKDVEADVVATPGSGPTQRLPIWTRFQ